MQRERKRHLLPWFSSRRSWRRAWPWRWRGCWGGFPYRGPWKSPIRSGDWDWIIIIYSFGDIDNSGLVLGGHSLGSCCLRHEGPELVEVHGGAELLVSLQTEVPHSSLTEVPGMATSMWLAYQMGKYQAPPLRERSRGRILRFEVLTICSCWFSCDAYHRQDLCHQDAFCAFQLYRDRVKRVLSTSLSFLV